MVVSGPADKVPMKPNSCLASCLHMCVFCILIGFQPLICFGGDLYKWVDEEGVVHMTDSPSQIPEQYRGQANRRTLTGSKPEYHYKTSSQSGTDLKHIEVPYKAFEGSSRRIIIPVVFNDSVTAYLALDTGSPGLLLSPGLASRLGLLDQPDESLRVMAGGVGGNVPAVLAVVENVRVGDASADFLPAIITQIPSDEFEGLVGMDFMANYKIGIDTQNNVLSLDELPPHPDRPGGHDQAWWRSNFQNFSNIREAWRNQLNNLEKEDMSSSEKESRAKFARSQFEAANDLYQKLERYARDNAVPNQWKR
jgi:hypothetical protein